MNVRLRSELASQALIEYLERQIASGALGPGDRLPTERELVREFGVARNTVRKTLQILEDSGRIVRHVGRGTFVASGGAPSLPGFEIGTAEHDGSPADVLECRLLFEPAMMELAVLRASRQDLNAMTDCLREADRAPDWRVFEHWDDQFHKIIARSTRNEMIMRVVDALSVVRRQAAWGRLKERSLTAERRAAVQRDHYAILRALADRDAGQAVAAMRRHIRNVQDYMFEQDRDRGGDTDPTTTAESAAP